MSLLGVLLIAPWLTVLGLLGAHPAPCGPWRSRT